MVVVVIIVVVVVVVVLPSLLRPPRPDKAVWSRWPMAGVGMGAEALGVEHAAYTKPGLSRMLKIGALSTKLIVLEAAVEADGR